MIEISSYNAIDGALSEIDLEATKAIKDKKSLFVTYTVNKNMTRKQQSALHVWCELVARALNESNEFREVIHPITKKTLEWEWTKESVKEDLYKPTLRAYCGKDSTMDQDTVEPSLIAEALSRAYAKHRGIPLPMWPSRK